MKRLIGTVAALMFVLALALPLASARPIGDGPVAQDPSADETAAYKAWYDAYTAKDNAKRVELGKAFIQKYPNNKYVPYVKADIASAQAALLNAAVAGKNVPDIIRLTKDMMADNNDTADYPYFLVNQLRTLDTNFQYASDMSSAAEAGTKALQDGKPFKLYKDVQKNAALAFYQDTLASIDDHNKKFDSALQHYEQAADLDPKNPRYFYYCGRLHSTRYSAALTAYQKFPDADRSAPEPKPEVKTALDLANSEADAVINCWSRFLGLTATDLKGFSQDTRTQILKSVGDLYEYRNGEGTKEGLKKLIDDNASSPTPVKMPPPVKPQPQKADEQGAAAKPASSPQPAGNGKPAAGRRPRQ